MSGEETARQWKQSVQRPWGRRMLTCSRNGEEETVAEQRGVGVMWERRQEVQGQSLPPLELWGVRTRLKGVHPPDKHPVW